MRLPRRDSKLSVWGSRHISNPLSASVRSTGGCRRKTERQCEFRSSTITIYSASVPRNMYFRCRLVTIPGLHFGGPGLELNRRQWLRYTGLHWVKETVLHDSAWEFRNWKGWDGGHWCLWGKEEKGIKPSIVDKHKHTKMEMEVPEQHVAKYKWANSTQQDKRTQRSGCPCV
jgi:hypothetical protein